MANRRKLILPPVLTVIILLLLAYEQKVGSAQETPSGTSKRVSISAGVAIGMLLQKTQPIYPPIAKAARVSGTVVLQATISKAGTVENLHIVSGPDMLRQAAMDAVRTWRYRPYLFNNEPVEVATTVNVIFTLGDGGQSSSAAAEPAATLVANQGVVTQVVDEENEKLGVQDYYQQRFTDALPHFLAAAKAGNKDAFSYLGYMYEYGRGVQVDLKEAAAWYGKSVAAGNAADQTQLDEMLRRMKQQASEAAPNGQNVNQGAPSTEEQSPDYDSQLASAMVLVKADNLADARSAVYALVNSAPNRWEGYGLEGNIDERENNLIAAKAAYQRALQLAPADVKPQLAEKLHSIEAGTN
jgi:TonB family protein